MATPEKGEGEEKKKGGGGWFSRRKPDPEKPYAPDAIQPASAATTAHGETEEKLVEALDALRAEEGRLKGLLSVNRSEIEQAEANLKEARELKRRASKLESFVREPENHERVNRGLSRREALALGTKLLVGGAVAAGGGVLIKNEWDKEHQAQDARHAAAAPTTIHYNLDAEPPLSGIAQASSNALKAAIDKSVNPTKGTDGLDEQAIANVLGSQAFKSMNAGDRGVVLAKALAYTLSKDVNVLDKDKKVPIMKDLIAQLPIASLDELKYQVDGGEKSLTTLAHDGTRDRRIKPNEIVGSALLGSKTAGVPAAGAARGQ